MPRSELGFADAFLLGGSYSARAEARGEPHRVFDWIKAAQLIGEHRPRYAEAGLDPDWNYTSGAIWSDGEPVPIGDTYTYLASRWAIPTLVMDGEEFECWKAQEEVPDWDAHTYWPDEALAILNHSSE